MPAPPFAPYLFILAALIFTASQRHFSWAQPPEKCSLASILTLSLLFLFFKNHTPQESCSPSVVSSDRNGGARHPPPCYSSSFCSHFMRTKASKENRTLCEQLLRARREPEGVSFCSAPGTHCAGPCGRPQDAVALGIQFKRAPKLLSTPGEPYFNADNQD